MEIAHVRCEAGEKVAIISTPYLSPLPKIESAEMMFSASRSRRLQIVPIIQSFAQLEKNYGKEGADVIIDNTADHLRWLCSQQHKCGSVIKSTWKSYRNEWLGEQEQKRSVTILAND